MKKKKKHHLKNRQVEKGRKLQCCDGSSMPAMVFEPCKLVASSKLEPVLTDGGVKLIIP